MAGDATSIIIVAKNTTFLRQKPACRDKSVVVLHVFVATKHATKVCLSRQNFCRDRHVFVTTFFIYIFFLFLCFLFLSRYTYFFSRQKFCRDENDTLPEKGRESPASRPLPAAVSVFFVCVASSFNVLKALTLTPIIQRSEGSDADTYYSTF